MINVNNILNKKTLGDYDKQFLEFEILGASERVSKNEENEMLSMRVKTKTLDNYEIKEDVNFFVESEEFRHLLQSFMKNCKPQELGTSQIMLDAKDFVGQKMSAKVVKRGNFTNLVDVSFEAPKTENDLLNDYDNIDIEE